MLSDILTIIVGVAGVVATLVGPLYYIVLGMRGDEAQATAERNEIVDAQDDYETDIDQLAKEVRDSHEDLHGEIGQIRTMVEGNAQRSERNQEHIHQILLGEYHMDEDDEDMANPHYRAEHCPLPDECPFCTA